MAKEIIWTKNALDDLKDIVDYLKQEWSQKSAEKFIDKCFTKIKILSHYPLIGLPSKKITNARRILISKQQSLYYRIDEDKIFLLDFFDLRQDPEKSKY
jgi:addiction module RelE/StbE family toxin